MEEKLKDKLLICKDCKRKFIFDVRDQKFFGQKDWKDPIRCLVCRDRKRIAKSLKDEVPIKDRIRFSEICEKCKGKFYTKFRRREGEKMYCPDCWKIIKGM